MNPLAFPAQGRRGRMSGMSLIELMVAMVLGLVVMGAAFAVFMSNQATFRVNEDVNRIQESARIAFELISRDIRAGGGSACSNASVVETSGAESVAFSNMPVSGNGTELTVLSGDDVAYRVTGSTSSSVTLDSDQISDARDAFQTNDLLLLCNARKTFLVTAGAVTATTVNHTTLPGEYDPVDDEFAPPASVVLARFRNVRWFVADNGRGGSSLFVARNGSLTGDEVAEGVDSITFEYLNAGAAAYAAAPGNNVIAVRTTMTLTGRDVDGDELTRTASNVVSLRGRTL